MRYKCGICIEQLENPVLIRECGHLFCEACLSQWATVRKNAGLSCPFCRTDYTARGLIRVEYSFKRNLQNNELCTKKNDLEEQLTAKKEARERKSANYEKLLSELESSVKKAEAQLRLNEDLEQRLQLEYESKEVIVKGKEKELTVCRNFFRKIGEKRFKERPEDQSQVQSAFNMAIQRINRCRGLINEKRHLSDQLNKTKALLQDLKSFLEGLGRLRLQECLNFTSFQSACEVMGWPAPVKKTIQPSTSAMEPPKIPAVAKEIPEKMKTHQRLDLISKKLYSGLVDVPTPKPKPANAFEKMRMMREDEKLLHLPREDENNRPPDRFPKFIMADRNGQVLKPPEPKTVGPIDLRYPTKEELQLKRRQREEALRREVEQAEAAKNKDNSLIRRLDDINTNSGDGTTLNITSDASMINSPLQTRDNKFNVRSFSEAKRKSLSKICGVKPKHNATIRLDSDDEDIDHHEEDKIEKKGEKKKEDSGSSDISGKNKPCGSEKDKTDKPPKAPSSHLPTASAKTPLDISRNSKIELYQTSQPKSVPKTTSKPAAKKIIVLDCETQPVKPATDSGANSEASKDRISRPETSGMPKITSISRLLENQRKRRSDERDDATTKRPKAAAVNRNARSTGSVQKISTFLKKPDKNNSIIILD